MVLYVLYVCAVEVGGLYQWFAWYSFFLVQLEHERDLKVIVIGVEP